GRVNIAIIANDVTKDITEASALADISSNSLKLVETLSETGYWRVNLTDNSLFWSDRVFEIHGLDKESFTPSVENGLEAYHPDDRQMVADMVERAAKDGTGFSFKARIVHANGKSIWVKSLGEVVHDDNGVAIAVVGSFREVSAETLALSRLTELESEIDHLDLAYFSHDVLTDTSYCSPSYYRLLQLDPGKEPGSFAVTMGKVVKKDQARLKKAREAMIAGKGGIKDTFRVKLVDGKEYDMRLEIQVARSEADEVTNYFGTFGLAETAA
ncbi:MAG: PAS domain-containing protein, partial [Litoreibacter sp.]|nr:PAS domain-containing protein [Litoreibacter sp.]